MPQKKKNKAPPGPSLSPPKRKLDWQQLQKVFSEKAPTFTFSPHTIERTLAECELRYLKDLSEAELQSPVRVLCQIQQAHWFYIDHIVNAPQYGLKRLPLKQFGLKLFEFSELLKPMLPNFEAMFAKWKDYTSNTLRYGCIMLNEELTKMVLVCNWNGDCWSFPKGKVNENEYGATCAAREVFEETGYFPTGLSEEDSFNLGDGGGRLYLHRGVPLDYSFQIQVRYEISKVRFFAIDDYPSNSSGVERFLPQIKHWCEQTRNKPKPAVAGEAAADTDRAFTYGKCPAQARLPAPAPHTQEGHRAQARELVQRQQAAVGAMGNHSNSHELPRDTRQADSLRGGGEAAAGNTGSTDRTTAHFGSNNGNGSTGANVSSKWQFARGNPFAFDLDDIMSVIPKP